MRLSKRELFAAMRYAPHVGQLLVHRSKAQRRVLCCGARWGKSVCASMEAVAALLEPRESSIAWICAPSYDLCERVFMRVTSTMQQYFPHRVKEINPREKRLVVCNFGGGLSELRAKSADNPSSLLGEGLDWLVVDEAAQLRDFVWHEFLSQRLVDKQGWCALLSTPTECDTWFYREFKRGQRGRDAQYESWQSASWTNPHLDRDVIEQERARLPAEVFRTTFEAQFIGWDTDPCELCGGPPRRGQQIMIVTLSGASYRMCLRCRLPVGRDGKALVGAGPDGGLAQRVVLVRDEDLADEPSATPVDAGTPGVPSA